MNRKIILFIILFPFILGLIFSGCKKEEETYKKVRLNVKETEENDKNDNQNKKVNPNFITAAVDFFRTYADRFHHGKEEGILFRSYRKRN